MYLLFLLAVVLCYWGLGIHERKIRSADSLEFDEKQRR
jgi:hypothetical protein